MEITPQQPQAPDPSMAPVHCEVPGCNKVLPVNESFSFALAMYTTGPRHVEWFHCPAIQHFACSMEHARAAILACLDEHMIPHHTQWSGDPDHCVAARREAQYVMHQQAQAQKAAKGGA